MAIVRDLSGVPLLESCRQIPVTLLIKEEDVDGFHVEAVV